MAGTVVDFAGRLPDVSVRFPRDVIFLSFRVYVLDTSSHSPRVISIPTLLYNVGMIYLYPAFAVSAPMIGCITQGMSLYYRVSSWVGSANTPTPELLLYILRALSVEGKAKFPHSRSSSQKALVPKLSLLLFEASSGKVQNSGSKQNYGFERSRSPALSQSVS